MKSLFLLATLILFSNLSLAETYKVSGRLSPNTDVKVDALIKASRKVIGCRLPDLASPESWSFRTDVNTGSVRIQDGEYRSRVSSLNGLNLCNWKLNEVRITVRHETLGETEFYLTNSEKPNEDISRATGLNCRKVQTHVNAKTFKCYLVIDGQELDTTYYSLGKVTELKHFDINIQE